MRTLLRRLLGLSLTALGGLLWAYWVLFMSSSHSYASPAFAAREDLVQLGGSMAVMLGLPLLLWPAGRPALEVEPSPHSSA